MSKSLSFKLTDASVFEDNPEFAAIPEFERLTERQMRYVMLVDFHGSPLRLMAPADRKLRAAIMAGYKNVKGSNQPDVNTQNLLNGKVGSIEAARKVMNAIQYDNERELMGALNFQIDEMIKFFKKGDKTAQELDKAVQMMTKLPAILETKKRILEILNFRDQSSATTEEAVQDDVKTSLLDEYNNN